MDEQSFNKTIFFFLSVIEEVMSSVQTAVKVSKLTKIWSFILTKHQKMKQNGYLVEAIKVHFKCGTYERAEPAFKGLYYISNTTKTSKHILNQIWKWTVLVPTVKNLSVLYYSLQIIFKKKKHPGHCALALQFPLKPVPAKNVKKNKILWDFL